MRKPSFAGVWLVMILIWPDSGHCSEFQLYPLRLTLSQAAPIAAFKLTNTGVTAVRVQLAIQKWDQGAEGDVFSPTQDLLGNPPLFEVPPKGTQTIRIGLGKLQQGDTEKTYRAFFQEVPNEAKSSSGIQTLLRVSVPMFIPPLNAKPLQVSFGVISTSGKRDIEVHNDGNKHVQLTKITLTSGGRTIFTRSLSLYVLPGRTVVWHADPREPAWPANVHVEAESDQDPITADTGDIYAPSAASH